MTSTTPTQTPTPEVVTCNDCYDDGACPTHDHAKVACGRCSSTGLFITGTLNGKPVSPGGKCYRCGGKGYHTPTDRKRNAYYDANQVVRF
jgi:hypothetical protein